MPLDTSIPLEGVQPKVSNPIQTIGALMQLKGQMSENVLRQAQAKEAEARVADVQAQAQQRQRDLASTAKLQDVMMDPANHEAFGRGDYSPIYKAGISPNVAGPAITNLQTLNEKALTLQKGKAEYYAGGRQQLKDILEGLDPTNDKTAAANFNGAIDVLGAEHPELRAQLQPLTPGPQFRDQVKQLAAQNGIAHAILLNNTELQGKQAIVKKDEAAATASTAAAGLHNVETGIKQAELDSMKATPEQLAAQVAGSVDPKKYPEVYARTLNNAKLAVTHAERIAAIHAGSQEIGKREDETNPALGAFRRNQAISTEVGKQVALAKLAPGGFDTIVNPTARAAAMVQYEKDSKDYGLKVADANRLQDFVVAAQSGNQNAPGLIPMAEVKTLFARANQSELNALGSGAGSLFQRAVGAVDKAIAGQPISPDMLKDIAASAEIMKGAAKRGYLYNLAINKATHGGNPQPIDPDAIAPPSKAAPQATNPSGHKVGDTVTVGGKKVKIKTIYPDGSFDPE